MRWRPPWRTSGTGTVPVRFRGGPGRQGRGWGERRGAVEGVQKRGSFSRYLRAHARRGSRQEEVSGWMEAAVVWLKSGQVTLSRGGDWATKYHCEAAPCHARSRLRASKPPCVSSPLSSFKLLVTKLRVQGFSLGPNLTTSQWTAPEQPGKCPRCVGLYFWGGHVFALPHTHGTPDFHGLVLARSEKFYVNFMVKIEFRSHSTDLSGRWSAGCRIWLYLDLFGCTWFLLLIVPFSV